MLLDGHIFNVTNLVVGEDFWNSLTEDQQKLLVDTCKEAGVYQNGVIDKMEGELLEKFKAEGVTIVDPSPELKQSLVDASKKFYSLPEF